jgi:Sulfatase-modifying factor enzyme 1
MVPAHLFQSALALSDFERFYREVRHTSERLGEPLSDEDATVRSMTDASPAKWHLPHTTCFFSPHPKGYRPFDERSTFLFNSYYETLGARQPRSRRGMIMITRPASGEVFAYRAHVDQAVARLVINAEWVEFIEDGRYTMPPLWLSEGWAEALAEGCSRQLYWETRDGQHWTTTLRGFRLVDPTAPVVHVSYFEADAFATWSGKQLPSEGAKTRRGPQLPGPQSPQAQTCVPTESRGAADARRRLAVDARPVLALPALPRGRRVQWQVHVGAVRFARRLLRDAAGHLRASYRNFFPAHTRWQFAGLRLAEDTPDSSAIGETKGETK